MSARVAVFMPTFRCREWLENAIASVVEQTWRPLDLYVVDDASGDLDRAVVTAFRQVTFIARASPARTLWNRQLAARPHAERRGGDPRCG